MNESIIHRVNVNPFFGSLIQQSFAKGYNQDKISILILDLALPIILYAPLRLKLMSINSNKMLSDFVKENEIDFLGLQERVWEMKKTSRQSVIILHNEQKAIVGSDVIFTSFIDYEDYNADMKGYLRAAYYLGLVFTKEQFTAIFKQLKVIP
jgi:hypothetical protein